jgi:hypothetical protein
MDRVSVSRGQPKRVSNNSDVVCLGWWANGGPLTSEIGVTRTLRTLATALPEVLPSRWDLDESYSHSLKDEGIAGLIEFVHAHPSQTCLRAKAPARSIQLFAVPPTIDGGQLRCTCFLLELDVSVLKGRGAAQRLPAAFQQLADEIQPFYAETRIMRSVPRGIWATARYEPGSECYPFLSNLWWGLPVKAPVAALLGNPYRQYWPNFGTSGTGGLLVDNPRPWTGDLAPLAWHVPRELCQPFDPYMSRVASPAWQRSALTFQLITPTVRAELWPFDDAST